MQFLLLFRENLFVNQISDFAYATAKDMHDDDKEDRSNAHYYGFAGLLPIDQRINDGAKVAIGSARQIVDQREYRVPQAQAS